MSNIHTIDLYAYVAYHDLVSTLVLLSSITQETHYVIKTYFYVETMFRRKNYVSIT